jgi:hypothetical protein
MPEIETQTSIDDIEKHEFKLISDEDYKKMTVKNRKLYRAELKLWKREQKRIKYNEYMRVYMSHYRKMKRKYDPAYRESQKQHRREKYNLEHPLQDFKNSVKKNALSKFSVGIII